ncbi:DUF11 domain-containing protein [Erythrobacter vulgaris]|uniref:DUF11 domain-containing protein n=1 Tax=Qipengyuania vulgaris TaxID=291985 RepID=A0A844XTT1_9SPHN|nr:DUF11 domain-containing protein [Qipengyuania vulgaris]MXO49311.1 DUF11 domain-containing protein [Qipengyuania vulgaris]
MKRTSKLLGAVSALPLIALGASPAFAEGTNAGQTIQNSVSVSYSVGGVSQNDETATDEFVVDRKVNVTVAESGGEQTIVSPGAVSRITTFSVTNLSNDTLDFALTAAQQAGGAGGITGTDNFDTSNVTILIDRNGDGTFVEATFIDELAADASVSVQIRSDIPLGRATGDVATVVLTAQAHAGGSSGSQGALLENSDTNTVNAVDTVLADAEGLTDGEYDGAFSAADDYVVSAAALSVAKTSTVLSDPVSGTANPKAIPGAVIEYCIAVSNAAGSATASGVTVTDSLPTGISYFDTATVVRMNGPTCDLDDATTDGLYNAGTITGSLEDIAAGTTRTVIFQATID